RTEADARSGGGGRDAAPTGQALLSQVSQTAQRYNVKPNRLQPEGTDGVSVWFDAAPFDNLVGWLEEEARQGVIVRQISIDRQDQPGVVNARVVLRN
ncbi:MAG: type II secretion system protein M, partial [Caldilineaceae bacterium]|nr:type II secretion system protein M [Caldilineaceae bacterium]